MVNAIYASIWFLALWKWGDWKNWQKYYATILFFFIGDFIYLYLLSDQYPMWKYTPPASDSSVGVTNTHVSLSIMAIKYPATALIYLSKFPDHNKQKQLLYIGCWVIIYIINEAVDLKFNLIKYYNGWNLWWSVLFDVVMFSILRIHYRNPLLAWLLSIGFIVSLWHIFDVPSTVFR